jgi:hypothetical protein
MATKAGREDQDEEAEIVEAVLADEDYKAGEDAKVVFADQDTGEEFVMR